MRAPPGLLQNNGDIKMALVANELIIYGSANMQEDNSSTPQGGAIDETTRLVFTDMSQTSTIDISGSLAGDSGNMTVIGRVAGGALLTEVIVLSGTTLVTTTGTFERVLKLSAPASHPGSITVTVNADNSGISVIESGVDTIVRPFMSVTGESAGGSSGIYYEKAFLKNTNASSSLLTASIVETAAGDGTEAFGADIKFDLENVVDGVGTSTNRITAPTGVSSGVFNDELKNVPGTNLAASGTIGIWLQLTVPPGTSAFNTTFSLDASGSSS